MSYTTIDAMLERTDQIEEAVRTGDVEALYAISDSYAMDDDMEQASYFRMMARSIENADWAYDRNRDNNL